MTIIRMMIVLIGVAAGSALLTGCGNKDQQQAQQPVRDSLAAGVMPMDTSSIPAVVNDSSLVLLKYRVLPGEVYHYLETVASHSEGTFNNVPSNTKEDSKYYFSLRMQGVQADSTLHAIFTFDSVVVIMESPQGARMFSSKDSTQMNDPQYALYSKLIGVPLPLAVSPGGEILRVDSVGGIADNILALNPNKGQPLPPNARESLIQQITDGAVKSVAQHAFVHFHTAPVGKDSQWVSRFNSMADVFPTENTIQYTLKEFKQSGTSRSAVIASKLGVQVTTKKMEDSTASVALKDAKFGGDATVEVDIVRGLTIRKQARMMLSMEISAKGRGDFASRMGVIKKTMFHETTVERIH